MTRSARQMRRNGLRAGFLRVRRGPASRARRGRLLGASSSSAAAASSSSSSSSIWSIKASLARCRRLRARTPTTADATITPQASARCLGMHLAGSGHTCQSGTSVHPAMSESDRALSSNDHRALCTGDRGIFDSIGNEVDDQPFPVSMTLRRLPADVHGDAELCACVQHRHRLVAIRLRAGGIRAERAKAPLSTRWSSSSRSWKLRRPEDELAGREGGPGEGRDAGPRLHAQKARPQAIPGASAARARQSSRGRPPAPACGSSGSQAARRDETLESCRGNGRWCRTCARSSTPAGLREDQPGAAPFTCCRGGFAGRASGHDRVEKYGQHQPLNRAVRALCPEGVDLSLSTLPTSRRFAAVSAADLRSYRAHVFAGSRVHGDETPVPVLQAPDPQGRLWTYVRDDRPFGGRDPPAAVFFSP